MRISRINSKNVVSKMRLDGKFHLSDGLLVRRIIARSPYGVTTIGELTHNIYCPGIFRRIYLKNGVPFLGGGDIQKFILNSGKFLNKANTPNWESLKVEKGWTLVTCGGTIGDTVFANNILSNCWVSQHVMRVIPSSKIKEGMLFAYLATKYGKLLLTTGTYGSVIPTLNSDNIAELPIPIFPKTFQEEIDSLIQESAKLREEATEALNKAQTLLKEKAALPELSPENYDYYGPTVQGRKVSAFIRKRKDIDTITFNAFNHSERIRELEKSIVCKSCRLEEVLLEGEFFSTGSFPRVEVKEKHGIMLINQSDIFDNIIKGKYISKRGVKTDNLVEYGEVMIAGVGTLGENETFCRTIFANEDLVGQLVSGEFIRMKTNGIVPSGYLYAWLSSEYGFRLIRSTQAGTKLCRPIQKLLLKKKIPIIDTESMNIIDELVRDAHTMRHKANQMELKAISMVEQEIEKWSN